MDDIDSNLVTGWTQLIESINTPVFILDKQGELILANNLMYSFLSISKEEHSENLGLYPHLAPFHTETYKQIDREIVSNGSPMSFEGIAKNGKGEELEVVYQKAPLKNNENEIVGVVTVLELRTAFNEMRTALAKSESQRHAILDGYPGVLALFNEQEELIWANDSAENYFENPVGKTFSLLFGNSDDDGAIKVLKNALLGVRDVAVQELTLNRSGYEEEIFFEIIGAPVQQAEYETSRTAIIICRDVSERFKLEKQLRHAQKMEAIGTLAGGVAHDFNNVLTPIMGYSEILRMKMKILSYEDADMEEYLDEILRAARRAKGLVEQILTFSRSREQKESLQYIHPIVKEVMKLLRVTLPSTIKIEEKIDESCGMLFVDPVQIHQVLLNLCTNASHAIRGGHGSIKVSLKPVGKMYEGKSWVELSVEDSGCGIEANMVDRIFEPYFTTKEKEHGTGMGLAMVHGIIKRQGGRIEVESEIDKGTIFTIYLPISEKTTVNLEQVVSTDELVGGSESILLVDDEEQVVQVTSQLLSSLGYDVVGVTTVEEALAHVTEGKKEFSLMLTDLTMPEKTGVELAAEIKEMRPEMAMVLFTGYSDQFSKNAAQVAGIDAYCVKPVSLRELSKIIRATIDKTKRKFEK